MRQRDQQEEVLNIDDLIELLYQGKQIQEGQIKLLCEKAQQIFQKESNVQPVQCPVTICGNIYGQFSDLIELFRIGGKIPYTSYLFLGDYVSKGSFSVESISLLIALKVRYRDSITLLRGRQESRLWTMENGFYQECLHKFGNANVWKYFIGLFDYLPLTAIIENQILCIHGGLSQRIKSIDDIRKIDRFRDTDDEQKGFINSAMAMSDIIYNSPDDIVGWSYVRGPGFVFGKDITQQFLKHNNDISLIISTQRFWNVMKDGYEYQHDKKILTVMSTPNYRNMGNQGSIIEIDENMNIMHLQFDPAPCQDSSY